jgi:hypothetical protein
MYASTDFGLAPGMRKDFCHQQSPGETGVGRASLQQPEPGQIITDLYRHTNLYVFGRPATEERPEYLKRTASANRRDAWTAIATVGQVPQPP